MRNYQSRFRLPSGKWVYIQLEELAFEAEAHVRAIRKNWNAPSFFFHYQRGGHVAALRSHSGNPWLAKLDLSNFFGNVRRNRVTRSLKTIGFSFRDAEEFAVASTVRVDHRRQRFGLPYGFVQSPLLASLALDKSDLGNCLRQLMVTATVYVDDIIVSGHNQDQVQEATNSLRAAAERSNFPVNDEKSVGPSTAISAFNIDTDKAGLTIAEKRYAEFCLAVQTNGEGPVSSAVLNYVRSVNDEQAAKLVSDFPRCFPAPLPNT